MADPKENRDNEEEYWNSACLLVPSPLFVSENLLSKSGHNEV